MAGTVFSSPSLHISIFSTSQNWKRPVSFSTFKIQKRSLICCNAKKKLGFVDQILDYIEGGPKLRKWYGAPDISSKDGTAAEEEVESSDTEAEVRDAVLVTDGDSEIGQEGFLSSIGSLCRVQHLSVYRGISGIQAFLKGKARELAEKDETILMASGIPYTIIRVGLLENTPSRNQGFSFEKGSAVKGRLSKEDAASICVEALDAVPQTGLIFEVANGEEKVSNWKQRFIALEEASQQLQ